MEGLPNVAPSMITREAAGVAIVAKARAEGYSGVFNVAYAGQPMAALSNLPEMVDMSLITLSEKLNQA